MNEPDSNLTLRFLPPSIALPLSPQETPEPATEVQDDLCHGKVGENVWYCPECKQYFDHPVTGPHPKPVREEEETPIPTRINRAVRRRLRRMQRQEEREEQTVQLVQVGVCRACMKPFIGETANRCQCKAVMKQSVPGQAELAMVQMVKKRGRVAA